MIEIEWEGVVLIPKAEIMRVLNKKSEYASDRLDSVWWQGYSWALRDLQETLKKGDKNGELR